MCLSAIVLVMPCYYLPRSGGSGCVGDNVMNFDYCIEHLQTPRGAQHMLDRVKSGQVVTQKSIEEQISNVRVLDSKDYQTSALEKMGDALDRVLEWEEGARQLLGRIDADEWRYTDRAGTEQVRSEVGIYERAQDRTTRTLTSVSKMAIEQKLVSLGKAQTEMIIRIIMGVINDMKLPEAEFTRAKKFIMQRLAGEANLAPRTKANVKNQLESVEGSVVSSV